MLKGVTSAHLTGQPLLPSCNSNSGLRKGERHRFDVVLTSLLAQIAALRSVRVWTFEEKKPTSTAILDAKPPGCRHDLFTDLGQLQNPLSCYRRLLRISWTEKKDKREHTCNCMNAAHVSRVTHLICLRMRLLFS